MKIARPAISKTFLRTLAMVAAAMLVLVLSLSQTLVGIFEQQGLSVMNGIILQSIGQTAFHIGYVHEMMTNFCTTNFAQPEVQHLMLNAETDDTTSVETIQAVNTLHQAVASNSMIDSVIVYNRVNGRYYASFNWELSEDRQVVDLVEGRTDCELLAPIPRHIAADAWKMQQDRVVLTYVLFESKNPDGSLNSALIVNVKTDWMFRNAQGLHDERTDLILAVGTGRVIADRNSALTGMASLPERYADALAHAGASGWSAISEGANGKRMVTSLAIPEIGWTLISDQPYDSVVRFIGDIRNRTLAVTLLATLLSLACALIVAQQAYKPFRRLLAQVKDSLRDAAYAKGRLGEAEYLEEVFRESMDRIRDLERYRRTTRDIVRENMLKTMLLENPAAIPEIREAELPDWCAEPAADQPVRMVLLKLDASDEEALRDAETRRALRFMICSTASEVLGERCNVEAMPMGPGECVVLVAGKGASAVADGETSFLGDGLSRICRSVSEITGSSMSAFASDPITDAGAYNRAYRELVGLSKVPLMIGSGVHTAAALRGRSTTAVAYPERTEAKILDAIRSGAPDLATDAFEAFLETVSRCDIDGFMLALTRLLLALNQTVNAMNVNRMNGLHFDFNGFYSRLATIGSREALLASFRALFESLAVQQETRTEERHLQLVDAVRRTIRERFPDRELCLKTIAADCRLSAMYLGTIFREHEGKSVQDSINEFRLEKATELLRGTQLGVAEIAERVGFEGLSSFYRLFRKAYGVTPKDYRTGSAQGRQAP